jgi:hypothetical protein
VLAEVVKTAPLAQQWCTWQHNIIAFASCPIGRFYQLLFSTQHPTHQYVLWAQHEALACLKFQPTNMNIRPCPPPLWPAHRSNHACHATATLQSCDMKYIFVPSAVPLGSAAANFTAMLATGITTSSLATSTHAPLIWLCLVLLVLHTHSQPHLFRRIGPTWGTAVW